MSNFLDYVPATKNSLDTNQNKNEIENITNKVI